MGQALYRKHRPKKLSEVVGQEHITRTLEHALEQGRISHAYLFTGPKGVGKTSIARILAHEINNLDYSDDSVHLDIIEIDAASNRRIDEIRELRDKVYVAPTSTKYKIYIIDEVHMLTKEAFNALLKTLEEPPEHAVFILATTDAHKLPETIISRTQRFSFKPVSKEKVAAHLKEIAKQEKIDASAEALELLADHGEGSFRDSISMLDQASSHGEKLDVTAVRQLLGIPPAETIAKLVDSLAGGDVADLISGLETLYGQGFQAVAIAKQLSQLLRSQVINGQQALASDKLFRLLDQLLKVAPSYDPERYLEICLLQAITPNQTVLPKTANQAPAAKPKAIPKAAEQEVEIAPESEQPTPDGPSQQLTLDNWNDVTQLLKQRHNTLYGIIRMANPQFNSDGSLSLIFSFAFHQKRMNEASNQQALDSIIKEVVGQTVKVNCVLDTSVKPKSDSRKEINQALEAPTEDLTAISNIFGSAELLESE